MIRNRKETADGGTVESKVAKTILQRPEKVIIGQKEYSIAPPSVATLILMSEEISKMPRLDMSTDSIVSDVLRNAKDCRGIGDILAVAILGAKGLTSKKKAVRKGLFGLRAETVETEKDLKAELSRTILEECTPKELNDIFIRVLKDMQLSDFFGLTVSLTEINLLRKTKETGTTASGR
ncbi:MAG: hypothetical protein NC115_06470 [Bacteroidales bacterium]|nr:hypothetical protein [Bacteroidales bacterium]